MVALVEEFTLVLRWQTLVLLPCFCMHQFVVILAAITTKRTQVLGTEIVRLAPWFPVCPEASPQRSPLVGAAARLLGIHVS